ncbi:hypothetical protein SBC1_53950 (plasmid) [Caballeronia sp. SBC1]|jgi:hypothetical protein|uniref:3-keto-5-aminohexanoate cleavage protein n=1 Tax=unclassified Caballeronia TaxID=2646786 RepID=UPI0013E19F5F|nr:hypothetical protein SBC2_52430 [Caballeronia sp. SBC2]QIN65350.1 hypothetical protein SBC1_53950 [Caballeronia sp. SBC1]
MIHWSLRHSDNNRLKKMVMHFVDASLPGDTDDVPVTMAAQVQKAVDCYNAGATVLHAQVHDADSKGSKGMFMLNEC